METVSPPTQTSEAGLDLHLLTEWETAEDRTRSREAGVVSVLVHGVLIAVLLTLPKGMTTVAPRRVAELRTPLVAPPNELTQREPNRGKISKEFNVEQLLPRPRIQIPPSPPSTTRPAAPRPSMTPSRPEVAPAAALPEPPKIEAGGDLGQRISAPASPPQIQAQEKPKLVLENPAPAPSGQATGRVAVPSGSVSEAIRSAVRGGAGGGLMVGDIGMSTGGIGEAMNQPPSPGRPGSALELLSDPMGVDFRPYLIRILSSVRRNWFAVMPESAKLGRRGKVAIQFSIARNGSVPKLVIVNQSGTEALDRAAVAGISASNPFPPLPGEFKGDRIRLQFTFAYNMPAN